METTYRAHIGSCDALAVEVNWFRHTCNTIRPQAAIGDRPHVQSFSVRPLESGTSVQGYGCRYGDHN
jgi:hypothetical protein